MTEETKTDKEPTDNDKGGHGVIRILRELATAFGGKDEDSSSYDLAFSYAGEWHPFVWGLFFGVSIGLTKGFPLINTTITLTGVLIGLYAVTGKWAKLRNIGIDPPTYMLRQIRMEFHYYVGGIVIGLGATDAFGQFISAIKRLVGMGVF